MRRLLLAFWLLAAAAGPALAEITVHFSGPGYRIGVNVPAYPTLQPIPGYPVYYAPALRANYFFYDGLYWVYEGNDWYASSWYNGPWYEVDPFYVPDYLLRVPVRYYRAPPTYFRAWRVDAPPRWQEHWGARWSDYRRDWERWDRRSVPAPAPLPTYQRQYSGSRYPDHQAQAVIETRNYRYEPRDRVTRKAFEDRRGEARNYAGLPPGLQKQVEERGSLPPGLQKHVDERGSLPPGLQRKVDRAEGRGDDRDRGEDQGRDRGEGRGRGHGKGHGRDKD